MEAFELTKLWKLALSDRPDDSQKIFRDKLRSSLFDIRARAAHLTTEIPRVLPSLTVHDLSHIDALWEMSDLVIGDPLLNPEAEFITPTEAFVLGVAFLVHDLAHSRSAIPLTDQELLATTFYRDIVAEILAKRLGHAASKVEIDSADKNVLEAALGIYLRAKHAALAAQMPTRGWIDEDGRPHYLIQNEDIRSSFGEIAGRVAASHWTAARQLPNRLGSVLGAPGWLPPTWTCDPLKLACIIRCADAIHLDSRRAPSFLQAIRRPTGESSLHWDFQNRLLRPRRENDRLIFCSSSSFPVEKAESWWKCYDTLSSVSSELWNVDALLTDERVFRFEVRSVAGVEDPRLLSKYVLTEGWSPVDAQIKVSDVPSLIERLGGKELYGDNVTVPLRELIQNGSDAILAKQKLTGTRSGSDCVDVSLAKENDEWVLEVRDSGVGMAEEELSGSLLDFGKSLWRSDLVRDKFPGLVSSGFEATGRYGIGFFSIFMMGAKVQVTSRRFDAASEETRVLELNHGAMTGTHPLLRRANHAERLHEGGTRVRIWLDHAPDSHGGLLAGNFNYLPKLPLTKLCAWLCPSLAVELRVKTEQGVYQTVVGANDWLTIENAELLRRVLQPIPDEEAARLTAAIKRSEGNVRSFVDEDGRVLGRGCILLQDRTEIDNKSDRGPITVGGCRASGMHNFGGVLIGMSLRAARDSARPLIDGEAVRSWATEQAELMTKTSQNPELLNVGAGYVRSFGGALARLPIALSSLGWMTPSEIERHAKRFDELILVSDSSYYFASTNRRVNMCENVLVCNAGHWQSEWPSATPWYWKGSPFHFWTLLGATVESLARGWSINLDAVLAASDLTTDDDVYRRMIAVTDDGKEIFSHVDVIRKPSAH